MILKIRTGINLDTGWRVIGNIRRVDYKYIDEPKKFGKNDEYINNFPDVENKRITQITMQHESGLTEVIWTDDMVYIMNNLGATCDTINV